MENDQAFIKHAWNLTYLIEVGHDDSNGWVFIFEQKEYLLKVLNGGSWFIRESWMLVAVCQDGTIGEKIKLWFQKIWLQMHNIHKNYISDHRCKLFASTTGRVLEVNADIEPGKPTRGCMVRLHVESNLRKPLPRGFFLNNNNNPVWVRFTFENLIELCIYCGLVGHNWKKCQLLPKATPLHEILLELEERKLDELGEWLRAEHKPKKPLIFPTQRKSQETTTACKQLQIVRGD
uniref:Zinc knuckle CX2CX4HX4C domain-containing protein n=1 Tax=Nelumbo nucifera TaxID=4432 RepID=A0A822Y1I9_NELNU|nr:TPA_asm: hypothetical protein HUJ06_024981 [Nelumbo nucifera]